MLHIGLYVGFDEVSEYELSDKMSVIMVLEFSKCLYFMSIVCASLCLFHFSVTAVVTFLSAQHYASATLAVIVCPSICHKTPKHRIMQTTPYDSPWTLVF